ncbi:gamma-glutamyltransferase family protein [Nitrincola tapanii]|uniref:Gamma-glutamyltransferase family protein n=1 Tax=Nitrincola tapanii TaxID=1708751 RepID=A0A5A9W1E4_9GAMM|nr:gamma-glutamyltransferase family protein [Nitrincola tapanii]KAA0874610.1 gamma-glutamyltransferase family protein [Nitrincola tapanii]
MPVRLAWVFFLGFFWVDLHAEPFIAPEVSSGWQVAETAQFQHWAVATAHPLASEAAHSMLLAGGSAVDAAIAAQWVLTLVEPQSSGIGGGGFMLMADEQGLQAYDGRETAPAAANEGLFVYETGEPWAFRDAMLSPKAIGVPGLLAMLAQAHQEQGQLPWAQLFEPALALAEQGFELTPRLVHLLDVDFALKSRAAAAEFFYDPDGQAWPVGTKFSNPALAEIFRRLAAEGAEAFYQGELAQALVAEVQEAGGILTLHDLQAYRAQQPQALCTPWRDWVICGFPPPSSGHITLMQILLMLDETELPRTLPQTSEQWANWIHYFTEASRLAFADRNRYLADPAFVPAPASTWQALLEPDYLSARSQWIQTNSMQEAQAGQPGDQASVWAEMPTQEEYGTTHISIVDGQGRALALTSSIEAAFGTRFLHAGGTGLPGGYFLNNQLTDFSFQATDAQGRLVANRVEAGKRPRSSMAPTLVFSAEKGEWLGSLGSPGGAAIIPYVARTLWFLQEGSLDLAQILSLPHALSLNGPTLLEKDRFDGQVKQDLRTRQHRLQEVELTSGVQIIWRHPDVGLQAAADPRREGRVLGR